MIVRNFIREECVGIILNGAKSPHDFVSVVVLAVSYPPIGQNKATSEKFIVYGA